MKLTIPSAFALATLGASPLVAQTVDFTVGETIPVVQALPGSTLTAGKSAFVRTQIQFTGTLPANTVVDGLMRVFVDGVEIPESPIYSFNGPIAPPDEPQLLNQNDTLNFVFLPPESDDVVLSVEVNPAGPGQVPETDFTNNVGSTPTLQFVCRRKPELVYVPIDYRPSGGGPNLPSESLIEPGVGDNFIQAVYPSGDWDYFRSDPPSKLWTNSLNGTGSGLLNSLLVDLQMMNPQPDFIYGWVPGSLPYNGQAIGIPGKAGMGNTQAIRHQRTFAHEIGHLVGRGHINNRIVSVGVDVEHQLNLTQGLPVIKPGTLNDIMVAGLLTNQAWVYSINYEFFHNHPVFQCSQPITTPSAAPNLLVAGLWNRNENTVELTDTVAFQGGIPSETVPLNQANLIVRVRLSGGDSQDFGLLVNTTTDSCADAGAGSSDSTVGETAIAGFVLVLPDAIVPSQVEEVRVIAAEQAEVMTTLTRSAAAPEVQLLSPLKAKLSGTEVRLDWSVRDADGDAVHHYLRYSPDGERLIPLAAKLVGTSYRVDLDELPALRSDKGYFELLSSDGLHTTRVRTPNLSSGSESLLVNPPETHVLTPDDGKSFPKGATVILHSSGWDLEDRAIEGASLVWSSDVDGVLATGRLAAVANLSVGAHVLTVTATDSDGLTSSDSTSITITDRPLPANAAVFTRNGGNNPASYTASAPVIGGSWTANVDLSGTGHTSALVTGHLTPGNTTLGGGQVLLISGPKQFELPLTAGPIASWTMTLPNDPTLAGLTLYTQAAHLFGVTPFALSNAQDLLLGF